MAKMQKKKLVGCLCLFLAVAVLGFWAREGAVRIFWVTLGGWKERLNSSAFAPCQVPAKSRPDHVVGHLSAISVLARGRAGTQCCKNISTVLQLLSSTLKRTQGTIVFDFSALSYQYNQFGDKIVPLVRTSIISLFNFELLMGQTL
jgi:hypothetical protein